jgi:hypothetical protein
MKRYVIIDHLIDTTEGTSKLELEIEAYANRGFRVHTFNNYRSAGHCGRVHAFVLLEIDK